MLSLSIENLDILLETLHKELNIAITIHHTRCSIVYQVTRSTNLIDDDNVSSLREFFDDALKTLENLENSIEKEELKNSIFLLQILLDINVKLTSIYNNQNTNEIDFEKEISLLEIYSKSHLNLWDTRNIHEGYKMSNQRILWLKEVLALAKTERS